MYIACRNVRSPSTVQFRILYTRNGKKLNLIKTWRTRNGFFLMIYLVFLCNRDCRNLILLPTNCAKGPSITVMGKATVVRAGKLREVHNQSIYIQGRIISTICECWFLEGFVNNGSWKYLGTILLLMHYGFWSHAYVSEWWAAITKANGGLSVIKWAPKALMFYVHWV